MLFPDKYHITKSQLIKMLNNAKQRLVRYKKIPNVINAENTLTYGNTTSAVQMENSKS